MAVTLVMTVALASCRTQDIRTQVIKVPQLANEECAQMIEKALRSAEGVVGGSDAIAFDYAQRTVAVRYDSMRLALKNLESIIAEVGFDANDTPADPKARSALPPACRGESDTAAPAPPAPPVAGPPPTTAVESVVQPTPAAPP